MANLLRETYRSRLNRQKLCPLLHLPTSAKNGLTICLTEERCQHITAGYPEAEEDGFVITAYLTRRIIPSTNVKKYGHAPLKPSQDS